MLFAHKFILIAGIIFVFLLTGCSTGGASFPQVYPAGESAQAEAKSFTAPADLSRIYLKWDSGPLAHREFTLAIEHEGTAIGRLSDQDYIYIDALPGTYSFSLTLPYTNNGVSRKNRVTEFDLTLAKNSVALLHCEQGSIGFRYITLTQDPVLRKFEETCPDDPNSNSVGIQSCQQGNSEPVNMYAYSNMTEAPQGTCQLINDTEAYAGYQLVNSAISTYLSTEESSYQLAIESSSLQGYQKFLADWPQTSRRSEIEATISNLSAREESMALENEVSAILQRDSALPLQAQRDKYMIALTGYLQTQDFAPSILYFELLDRLEVELSPSITHFWGEALLRTGDPERAIEKFYEYISTAGSEGTYYRDALALVNEAESQL